MTHTHGANSGPHAKASRPRSCLGRRTPSDGHRAATVVGQNMARGSPYARALWHRQGASTARGAPSASRGLGMPAAGAVRRETARPAIPRRRPSAGALWRLACSLDIACGALVRRYPGNAVAGAVRSPVGLGGRRRPGTCLEPSSSMSRIGTSQSGPPRSRPPVRRDRGPRLPRKLQIGIGARAPARM